MSSTPETVTLTIDERSVTVPKGTTVFHASKQLGIDIPVFCYQDRMPPFGACRMCLVQVEKMPKLQTSCTLEATDGMVVHTQSSQAVKGREDILEFLLINHPLDCPICDKGGECPLQEHAYSHGPGLSRFFEDKRHFKKPLPMGPTLMLDRERCIVCARCTRFGDLVAGDHALEFIDRGYKTEVGTPGGKPVDSKFIGNTIGICPVGALTSPVYRFRARPWDNDSTQSTCTLCPVGCSLFLDSRDGEIMRTRSREDKDVNDIWMCDKGWFGYEFSSSEQRLSQPLIRKNGQLVPSSWDEALNLISQNIQTAKPNGKLAGLGGNPLTTEENYLFQKLLRDGAGVQHIDHRVGMPIFNLNEEGIAAGMQISIGECEQLSYAFLLGIDITEEFPVIWLRLKQAMNKGCQASFIGHFAPEMEHLLHQTIIHAPGKELEILEKQLISLQDLAKEGKKGAFFIGSQYLNGPYRLQILSLLSKLCHNTPNLSLNILEGRGNSFGARLAGMRPDIGPNGEKIQSPGLNANQLIETMAKEEWDYLHIAGANPAKKYPSKIWNEARKKLKFLVVQDLFLTETAEQADLVLPALSFVEKGGCFINIEGRVQKVLPGKMSPEGVYTDGEIFLKIAEKLQLSLLIDPAFNALLQQSRLPIAQPTQVEAKPLELVAGEGLAASFAPALFDHGVRMKHNPHVIQLAKEPRVRLNPKDTQNRGIQDGDLVNIKHKDQSITGKTKLDEKVSEGTAVLPLGFPEFPVHELGMELFNGINVEIKRE